MINEVLIMDSNFVSSSSSSSFEQKDDVPCIYTVLSWDKKKWSMNIKPLIFYRLINLRAALFQWHDVNFFVCLQYTEELAIYILFLTYNSLICVCKHFKNSKATYHACYEIHKPKSSRFIGQFTTSMVEE